MVQHIVLYKLKADVDKESACKKLKKGFAALQGKVPGMYSIDIYPGYQGWDLCLMSRHESRDALEAYQQHPEHMEMKGLVTELRSERASCDFEL